VYRRSSSERNELQQNSVAALTHDLDAPLLFLLRSIGKGIYQTPPSMFKRDVSSYYKRPRPAMLVEKVERHGDPDTWSRNLRRHPNRGTVAPPPIDLLFIWRYRVTSILT